MPYQTFEIEYNADRLPQKVISSIGRGVVLSTSFYTYSNGNIISARYESFPYISVDTRSYVYDDKPNPYYGLIGFDRSLFDLTNRNNAIYALYSYEYDSNGLLTKVTANQLPAYTETYEYEPY